MASVILALALLASSAWATFLPHEEIGPVYGRRFPTGLTPVSPRDIEARNINKTIDIGWQVQDLPLFSADWNGGTGYIPLGPTPFETSASASFSLSVECNDCRTYGHIVADFEEDEALNLNMSLTFNQVGAYLDFDVFATAEGTYTIGLGRFFSRKGQKGRIFNATVGLGIDLVLQFTGDVNASTGFQIAIPDGEQIGLEIGFDPEALNFTAKIDLLPTVHFALLPIHFPHTSANISAALVLRAEAGLTLSPPAALNIGNIASISGSAKADLVIAKVTFGEVSSTLPGTCKQALFIDVDSSADAAAKVGLEVAGHEFERGPGFETVFAAAGTTRCIDGIPAAGTVSKPSAACPTGVVALTEVKNVTKTFALTSCLVSTVNCPASLSQVILVTDVALSTATRCPSARNTTSTTVVSPVPFYAAGSITLPPLTVPTTRSVSVANVTAPVNATVVGVAVAVPTLTTVPPEATAAVNVGGRNGSTGTVTTSSAGTRVWTGEKSVLGLVVVLGGAFWLL